MTTPGTKPPSVQEIRERQTELIGLGYTLDDMTWAEIDRAALLHHIAERDAVIKDLMNELVLATSTRDYGIMEAAAIIRRAEALITPPAPEQQGEER